MIATILELIHLSIQVMEGWREAPSIGARTGERTTLKWIFCDAITSVKGSWDMVHAALALVGKSSSEHCVQRVHKNATSDAERKGFDIRSGTTHVDRVLKMLTDHYQELGNLRVTSISVIKEKNDTEGQSGDRLSLAVQLG